MNNKKILNFSLAILFCSSYAFAIEPADESLLKNLAKNIQELRDKAIDWVKSDWAKSKTKTPTAENMQNVMQKAMQSIRPAQKEIYLKYYSEIKWLEKNYVTDRVKGDALLAAIHEECAKIGPELARAMCEVTAQELNENMSEIDKAACEDMINQFFVNNIGYSLKENAELKSSVYQELLAKKNKQK